MHNETEEKISDHHPILEIYVQALCLWRLGDWKNLSELDTEKFTNSPKAGVLKLLKASAFFQLGDKNSAEKYLEDIENYTDRKTIAQLLISGVLNSLGKARALNGDIDEAWKNFTEALFVAPWLGGNHGTLKARVAEQMIPLTKDPMWQIEYTGNKKLEAKVIKNIELGKAWAGNTANTVIFRHHAIFTKKNNQYTAFYVDSKTIRVVHRNLATENINTYDLNENYNLNDAHNSISLGMDRKGYIHIAYDHHGTSLNYRRSLRPYQIDSWSNKLPMTNKKEENITYPTFINPYNENANLLVMYRDGNWKKGSAYLKLYDEEKEKWFDYPSPILSGAEQKPWTSNAYWNHPAIDKDGCLHLSFTWRTDYFSEEKLINNINIDYAKTFDNGLNWYTSKNKPYKLPITPTNSETIEPISPGSNHINQTSMAVDSKGHPHIAFYADDENNIPQYYHLWFDGRGWRKKVISIRKRAFVLAGGGTLRIPFSRPEIIIDRDDNVFVIYRSAETGDKLVAVYLIAPDYQYYSDQVLTLWNEPVGQAEPIIDRERWKEERVLSLYIQYCDQPDHEGASASIQSNARIIDIIFQEI